MVRGVGFEPTQAYAIGSLTAYLLEAVLSPTPLTWLGHPRTVLVFRLGNLKALKEG